MLVMWHDHSMHRDPRLRDLSSDHHQGLVLARTIQQTFERGVVSAHLIDEVQRRYQTELRPHFEIEEAVLLPALEANGFVELARRTLREHEALHSHLEAAARGDLDRVRNFGVLLQLHIRFEEQELFPTCEKHLDPEVLETVAARTRNRPTR
jgi:hemerythrin-like domain-containing protein